MRNRARWAFSVAALAVLILATGVVGPVGSSGWLPAAGAAPVGAIANFTGTGISFPRDITAGPDGNVWFTNQGNGSIGRITPAGVVSNFTSPSISEPSGITAGPDGSLWFTNRGNSSIGRITTAGVVTNFPGGSSPSGITTGPDGNLWFTNEGTPSIGRITPSGTVDLFYDDSISSPSGIASGPDGNLWFTNYMSIGRITPDGVVSSFTAAGISEPHGIVSGPDGNLWFTNWQSNGIGRITPIGVVTIFYSGSVSLAADIAAGPDGNLWFTNFGSDSIGRITPDGVVSNFTGTGVDNPEGIAPGPDGRMWFTNNANYSIGRITALADPFGEYTAVTSARVFDTRNGVGQGGVPGALSAGGVRDVQITGEGGLPAIGVAAVVMNVTVSGPSSWGWVSVWPAGEAEPTVSNLNFVAGQTVANQVTVPIGVDGKVTIGAANATTDVIFDVVGSYSESDGVAGSRFHGITPVRFLDTRVPGTPLGPGETLSMKFTGVGGVPSSGVTAVALNVTVTQPTSWGWLTVYPGDASKPLASSINFFAGQTVANMVIVRVPADGIVNFYNQFGSTQVIADVMGYYDGDRFTEAGRFVPVSPERAFDSRVDWGHPIPPDDGVIVTWYDEGGQPLTTLGGIVANVTATQPTSDGWITAFPLDAASIPWVSNLNFSPGATVPNQVMVRTSQANLMGIPAASVAFYNPYGYTHVIVDIFGFFTNANITGSPASASGPKPAAIGASTTTSARGSHLRGP